MPLVWLYLPPYGGCGSPLRSHVLYKVDVKPCRSKVYADTYKSVVHSILCHSCTVRSLLGSVGPFGISPSSVIS